MTAATADNPLDVIASSPPRFSGDAARDIARNHYGLDVRARPLVSERDQNFRLTAGDGQRYVLKIANADEDPAVTAFQIAALRHIAAYGAAGVAVPEVVLTLDGADHLLLRRDGSEHVARLVTYLEGTPLDAGRLNTALAADIGRALACVGRALADFRHAGGTQTLLWDMKHALALRALLPSVPDPALAALLGDCLDDFETRALPAFASLRSQVIHNDMNPANVLVDAARPDRVAGVIDFGDMQYSPLIVDVAVAGAYLRTPSGDPLPLIMAMVQGYHSVTPLHDAELELLYDLVATRLTTTVALLHWRSGERAAGDAYLDAATSAEGGAQDFLGRWRALQRDAVTGHLRAACRGR